LFFRLFSSIAVDQNFFKQNDGENKMMVICLGPKIPFLARFYPFPAQFGLGGE
jgi:hypothetical protein